MEYDDFVRKFLEGDPPTLDLIYTKFFRNVARYIRSNSGTEKDAEDVFHNALLQLYVKLKAEEIKVQSFDNYLFTMCRNLWRRANAKNRVTSLDHVTLTSERLDQASFYLEQLQWELYEEKFALLSQQCRDILTMVFQKKSYAEIVRKYAYASQTVARQRVFKCKTRLSKLIKEDRRYDQLKS